MAQSSGTGSIANGKPQTARSAATTAEPLTASPAVKSARPRTSGGQTGDAKLTDREVLSILENSLKRVRQRWGPVTVRAAGVSIVLELPEGIQFCRKCRHLRVLAEMGSDECVYCQEPEPASRAGG